MVGDGALTGGMTWEALNNISDDNDRNLVIVVNDNGRSYAPTIGGMARYLNRVRTAGGYELLRRIPTRCSASSVLRDERCTAASAAARTASSAASPTTPPSTPTSTSSTSVPVDGHDLRMLIETLELAKEYGAPVIVHAITEKGKGYEPALLDEADQFHAVGRIDPVTGGALGAAAGTSWTDVFAEELPLIAADRDDIIAMTAAMLRPPGLPPFSQRFPDRVYDVGIAEQHAVASAAGLAYGGLHPVLAIYATFMNRAFDQVLMDVALHRAGVTFVLDRAGVTGPDGPSHHGIWDLAMLQLVPHIRIAVPRDAERLREELREAVEVGDAPTVLRFPKGDVSPDLPALERLADGVDVLVRSEAQDVLIVGIGPMAHLAVDVAERLRAQGIGATVVDPRWAIPVQPSIVGARGIPPPRHHDRGRHPGRRHRHARAAGAARGRRRHRGGRARRARRIHRPRLAGSRSSRMPDSRPRRSPRMSWPRCSAPASRWRVRRPPSCRRSQSGPRAATADVRGGC